MLNFSDSQKEYFKQKCYFLTLVTYLEGFEKIIVDNSDKIIKYAYAIHDKDEGKKTHAHLILCFSSDQTLMKYAKLFNTTEVTKLDKKGLKPMWDYLIHDTEKCRLEGKFKYDPIIRKSNAPDYFNPPKRVVLSSNISEMLDDVLRTSRRSFAIKYGFNAIIHYDRILQFSLRCKLEDEAIARGEQIYLDGDYYITNQSTGELVPTFRKKYSKFLSKHLTPVK